MKELKKIFGIAEWVAFGCGVLITLLYEIVGTVALTYFSLALFGAGFAIMGVNCVFALQELKMITFEEWKEHFVKDEKIDAQGKGTEEVIDKKQEVVEQTRDLNKEFATFKKLTFWLTVVKLALSVAFLTLSIVCLVKF